MRNVGIIEPHTVATVSSISPITIGNLPANRQVRRAGKRDGFELHAYLTYRIDVPNPSARISHRTGVENGYSPQDTTYGE